MKFRVYMDEVCPNTRTHRGLLHHTTLVGDYEAPNKRAAARAGKRDSKYGAHGDITNELPRCTRRWWAYPR